MFSLIICTYNPDLRIIQRALESVIQQRTEVPFELILVDNNSTSDLRKTEAIKLQLQRAKESRVIIEKRQGLTYARICGVLHAKYDVIVFVDDDNELDEYYLQNLRRLTQEYPEVKVWGAGNIKVDLIDGATDWVRKYMLSFYQERSLKEIKISNDRLWHTYYPVGSGMVIYKTDFLCYADKFNNGIYSAKDRKGDDLSSAGDSQIVWSVIANGSQIGSSPLLALTHIIPEKRTTMDYLKRLNHSISFSFYCAYYEIFNESYNSTKRSSIFTYIKVFLKALKHTNFNIVDATRVYAVESKWNRGHSKFLDFKDK